jgi:hypothetical protein
MPNPRLNDAQLILTHTLLADIRERLSELSNGDQDVLFAMRRKVQKELMHDERGTPAHRNKIKKSKRNEQNGLCAICQITLPEKNVVLDRFEAKLGYNMTNTRLIHSECDLQIQSERGFA